MRVLVSVLLLAACGGGGSSATPDAAAPDAGPMLCGNGVVDPGEACDDGDDDAFDSCVDCNVATCGDGFVRAAIETCDDSTATCVGCRTCEGVADPATNHCYTIVPTVQSRAAAQASCAAQGSHLIAIDSPGEWAAVQPLWTTPYPGTWIGLRRLVDGQNMWGWENGVALGTPTWNTGEPNDSGGVEDCVEAALMTGVWNDLGCTQTRQAMCERPTWSIDPATGHGYRIFYSLRTHPEAIADCGAMNTHLATITSAQEQAFVTSIVPMAVWIGAFQGATENEWYWPNAEDFEFSAWAIGQPDDFNGAEDCAQLNSTTREWNDLACTTRIPYLCEAD